MEGPKFCGKTTTSALFAKSEIRLNTIAAIQIARIEPYNVLIGERPRLIPCVKRNPRYVSRYRLSRMLQHQSSVNLFENTSEMVCKTLSTSEEVTDLFVSRI